MYTQNYRSLMKGERDNEREVSKKTKREGQKQKDNEMETERWRGGGKIYIEK